MAKPRLVSSTFAARRRWNATDAREALAALERSGLPLAEFAFRHGLDPQRLSYWRRRLSAEPERPRFEEIALPPSGSRLGVHADVGERFEIVLRSGRVVRVAAAFDGAALRRLVELLEDGTTC